MIIRYYGHSFFTLTLESGTVIALDPYGDFYAYPKRRIAADVCLISHHHGDHDGLSCLTGNPLIIDSEGEHSLAGGARVLGVPTCHDDKGGALRGKNIFFVVEAEGLRIGHAGDLGHMLTSAQLKQVGALDLLLVPVGGYYTIDAGTAVGLAGALKPRSVIPMHYRTGFNPDMPVAPVDDFLALVGQSPTPMPLLRVTARDMSERPPVMLMSIAEA